MTVCQFIFQDLLNIKNNKNNKNNKNKKLKALILDILLNQTFQI